MPAGRSVRARTRGKSRGSGQNERGHTILSAIRLPVSFVLALSGTIGLFWVMGLATSKRQTPDTVLATPRIDFSRLVRDSDTQEIARVKPEIKKIEPPPSPQN